MNERERTSDDRMDDAWRAALQREEAPTDFAARVLARLEQKGAAGPVKKKALLLSFDGLPASTFLRSSRARASMQVALAAMLMLAFVVPAGYRLHRQAELARGEAARQQVMLALRIAGMQLRSIQGRTQAIHIEAGILEGESQ